MKVVDIKSLRIGFIIFSLSLSQMMTAACSNREVPVTIHEGAIPESGPLVGDEVIVAPRGSSIDSDTLARALSSTNKKAVSTSEKTAVLESFERFVLNQNYLENPRITNTKQMRTALSIFGTTLIDLANSDAGASAVWIEKMRIAIESGCDGKMRGCTNLQFFRGDASSAKVMELSAQSLDAQIAAAKSDVQKRDELVRLYYRRLGVSFDLKNQIADSKFEFMYLAHAAEFSAAFERSEDKSRERDLLTRHTEVFEIILNRFNPDLSDPKLLVQFENFVNAFSPWDYSRRSENPFGQAATRMLSLAAKSFLYDKSGKLSPSLIESIVRSQESAVSTSGAINNDPLDSLDDSFSTVKDALKKQEPEIWKNLILSDAIEKNEYFFMVDRIFGDHLTPDDASEIWRGSRRDSKAVLSAAEQYIKIQIAAQIVRTNRYMSSIYSLKEFSSATLFQKAVEKSYPISTQWNQMLSRIDRIQLFLDRNLKASDECFSSKEFREVNQMLTSVRRNIKYLSVYPNMMLMAYFMAEAKFKLPIVTFFGSYEIDSSTIIGWFFDGKLAPLFNFGNDGDSLTRIETLYAFLFALKTETFKAFAVSDQQKLDIPKFFEVVVGKYLDADRIEIEQAVETIRRDMRNSSPMTKFLQVCREDRDFMAKGIKPGSTGNTLAIEFSKMADGVYIGSGGSGTYGNDAWAFYNGRIVESVKTINQSLSRKLDFVSTMTELLDKHLERSGVNAAERTQTKTKIESYVSNIRILQKEYLTEITSWNDRLSVCLDQSIPIEIDRQDDLIEMEIRHLKTVWKHMTAIRGGKDTHAAKSASEYLRTTLALKELESAANYIPISEITGGEYIYAELDVLLRMRNHLKQVAPNVRVVMPSDLTDTGYARERRQVTISYSESESEFVREALRNFNESYSAYVRWMNTTGDPDVFANRLKLNVELYKLSPMQIFDMKSPACQGKPNMTDCPTKEFKITAQEVVNSTSNTISMLSMTDSGGTPKKDTHYLQLIGATARWQKSKLKNFLLDENADPRTLFEMIFKNLTDDQVALNEARDFNRTENSVGHFLFQPEADFKVVLGQKFAPLVNNHFLRVNEIKTAILDREKSDAVSKKTLEYTYELRDGKLITAPIKFVAGVPIYLDRQKIDDFATTRKLFDSETGHAFVNGAKPQLSKEICR